MVTTCSQRWIALVFCLWAGMAGESCGAERINNACLVPEVETLDFGEVLPTDSPEKTVRIKNTCKTALTLNKVGSSCRCTTAEFETQQVSPGGSVALKVELHLSDYPANEVNTNVFIRSDSERFAELLIPVHATIKSEYRVTPEKLDFGSVKKGSEPRAYLLMQTTGQGPVKLERVEAPPELKVSWEKGAPPGDKHPAGQAESYKIIVSILPNVPVGVLNARLRLVTNVKRIAAYEVPVSANVTGVQCEIKPKVVVFGPSAPGSEIGRVEVSGSDELQVLSATADTGKIVCAVQQSDHKGNWRVSLALSPKADEGRLIAWITLHLQEGTLIEDHRIPVYGEIGDKKFQQ